ncbi:RNA polymerase subunit sigma-70 [Vibrio tarriae]|nr:RNA polymerase subunit sigma-70 [Vibrio tarriae]RBM28518.1 RNA polymerase subunit sigma-70 [Vibrio tarriae]RBM35598.1 RNA polymerase subunit sigma-70 [Vibrio tarriae]RBM36744.1 RNA polymerase subunit sigma-70 [Vibrio tarriae]RBM49120.1 RNA polymerase subunit sigma-70 [Vibrio tarriae]
MIALRCVVISSLYVDFDKISFLLKLQSCWVNLFTPITEHLSTLMRMNSLAAYLQLQIVLV